MVVALVSNAAVFDRVPHERIGERILVVLVPRPQWGLVLPVIGDEHRLGIIGVEDGGVERMRVAFVGGHSWVPPIWNTARRLSIRSGSDRTPIATCTSRRAGRSLRGAGRPGAPPVHLSVCRSPDWPAAGRLERAGYI